MISVLAFTLMSNAVMDQSEKTAFTFSDSAYVHRYTLKDLHEYTPKGQKDLNKWSDMITVNFYPQVSGDEGLASIANAVLGIYKDHGAMILKTSSVPRTEKRPAEHLVVVLFPQPDYIEAAFARFRMYEGKGVSLVYSHRVYGQKAGNAMSGWMKKNGPSIEKKLMTWETVPTPPK